jgi:hypothetical protein
MESKRALEILAHYEILQRQLDRVEARDRFAGAVKSVEWQPATKQTRLAGTRLN